jgi:hypothetical protein
MKLALIPPPDYPVLIAITDNCHFACLVIFANDRNAEGAWKIIYVSVLSPQARLIELRPVQKQ